MWAPTSQPSRSALNSRGELWAREVDRWGWGSTESLTFPFCTHSTANSHHWLLLNPWRRKGGCSDSAGIYPGAEERQDCSIHQHVWKGWSKSGIWDVPADSLIQVQICKIWIWATNLISRLVTAYKPLLVQFMMLQLLFSHCHPMEHMAHISLLNIFHVSKRHQPVWTQHNKHQRPGKHNAPFINSKLNCTRQLFTAHLSTQTQKCCAPSSPSSLPQHRDLLNLFQIILQLFTSDKGKHIFWLNMVSEKFIWMGTRACCFTPLSSLCFCTNPKVTNPNTYQNELMA